MVQNIKHSAPCLILLVLICFVCLLYEAWLVSLFVSLFCLCIRSVFLFPCLVTSCLILVVSCLVCFMFNFASPASVVRFCSAVFPRSPLGYFNPQFACVFFSLPSFLLRSRCVLYDISSFPDRKLAIKHITVTQTERGRHAVRFWDLTKTKMTRGENQTSHNKFLQYI